MKINFNQTIKQLGKDEPLLKPDSTEPFCLKDAAIVGLLSLEDIKPEEKAHRYYMVQKILANPDAPDFTVAEIDIIKQVIGKGYAPLVVGQAWEMLEGKE